MMFHDVYSPQYGNKWNRCHRFRMVLTHPQMSWALPVRYQRDAARILNQRLFKISMFSKFGKRSCPILVSCPEGNHCPKL
jgi:hypothetical protein